MLIVVQLLGRQVEASPAPDRIHLATTAANYRVALEELARNYERMHPHIDVQITIVTQGYETWIRTRFAGGGDLIPDIYNVNHTIGFEEQGKFVWLDDYLEQTSPYTGKPWRDGLDMPLVERYKWSGRTFSIPLDYIEIGIFYNKAIFERTGVEIPKDWAEFMTTCAKLQEAGYIPVSVPGDFNSFWSETVGWLCRILGDAYLRDLMPLVAAQPGDWNYDPERNAGFHYTPHDLYSDLYVVISSERLLNAVRTGAIDFQGAKFRAYHERLLEFSKYWQPGFMGTSFDSAMQLFYRQRSAMCILHTAHVTGIMRDFKRLDPDKRFEFGIFWFPPITNDPLVCGPFRACGGAGSQLGIVQKNNPRHTANVVDFLMYLTSPEAGRVLIERTLAEDQPLIGPLLIKGVELPEELRDKFDVFGGHGYERLNFRGLNDEQESIAEWVAISQEFMGGRLPIDDFLSEYEQVMLRAIPRLQKRFGYDMDPTTRDTPEEAQYESLAREATWTWNPFVNGTLAVALLATGFLAIGMFGLARTRPSRRWQAMTAYTLLAPSFLLLGTFAYFPALSGLYHAFTEWEPGQIARFNGLENFRTLLDDRFFRHGLGNMLILTCAGLVKATVVPFIAAEMILALRNPRVRYLFRTAFLIPMVVPAMVGILIWQFIYDPTAGLLNQILGVLGLEGLASNWLGEPHLALPAIIFMGFPWIGAFGLLIYMAGLMAILPSIYDAYRLESESTWRRLVSVDMPLVRGQTRLLVVLAFIGSLQDFQTILLMTGGGPGLATTVPALRMYHAAFRFFHFGYGAAIGFVLFVVILIITVVNFRVMKPAEDPG